jgi:hypothetical protein
MFSVRKTTKLIEQYNAYPASRSAAFTFWLCGFDDLLGFVVVFLLNGGGGTKPNARSD